MCVFCWHKDKAEWLTFSHTSTFLHFVAVLIVLHTRKKKKNKEQRSKNVVLCVDQYPVWNRMTTWQGWGGYGWKNWIMMSLYKGKEANPDYRRGSRSHATRPWMRYLAQWGPVLASLWGWARPSFPLLLFFSCLWVLNSTATLLSGNSSFSFLFLLWFDSSWFFFVFTFFISVYTTHDVNISTIHSEFHCN